MLDSKWQRRVNRVLSPALGVELQPSYVRRRAGRPGPEPLTTVARAPRLVPSPVFILCSVRSGSTLLRLMLNAHSQLHAPHELHLRRLHVKTTTHEAQLAVKGLDMDRAELEHLLWDRILHRDLERSGKRILIEKTPNNAPIWDRLVRCWPEARFIFLLRDPRTTLESWAESRTEHVPRDRALAKVVTGMRAVEDARSQLPGMTVRYEDLTIDPAAATRRICRFLGVEWEPSMLEYGRDRTPSLVRGVGDWREKIRTGQVQPPRPVPSGPLPADLHGLCRAWGYPVGPPGPS